MKAFSSMSIISEGVAEGNLLRIMTSHEHV